MAPERPTKLLTVFHYHQAPGSQPSPYTIKEGTELVELVTGGRGWTWHEGEWAEVLPGSLLWHAPGDQTIGRSDPGNPYSCLAVGFESASAEARRVPRLSYWHDIGAAVALADEAIRMFLDESFAKDSLLDYLYSKLKFEVVLHHHRREGAGIPEPLRMARSMIETRYAEPLRVSELAQAAGWSVAHLHDQFRLVYRSSPRQMILERRLRSAREQLVGTGLSIKQIAANTGFTHSSAFCSAFRRAFGATPNSYRQAYYEGVGARGGSPVEPFALRRRSPSG